MIKSTAIKQFPLDLTQCVFGSYTFQKAICIVQKTHTYWVDSNLEIIKKYEKNNKIAHPISQYETIQLKNNNQIILVSHNNIVKPLDKYDQIINGTIHTVNKNNYLVASNNLSGHSYLFSINPLNKDYKMKMKFHLGHERLVYCAKMSDNNLVTCSSDKVVRIFDINQQIETRDLNMPGYAYSLHFLSEKQFIIGGQFPFLLIYDLRTSKYQTKITIPQQQVSSVGTFNNSHLILGHRNELSTFDLSTFEIKSTNIQCKEKIWNINQVDKDKILVNGSNTVKIFNIEYQ